MPRYCSFSEKSEIVWKVNNYNKKEKKLKPLLNLSVYENKLLVTDSLSKIYLIDLNTGKLLCAKLTASASISRPSTTSSLATKTTAPTAMPAAM